MDRRQIIKDFFQRYHLEKDQIRRLYIEPIVEEFGLLSDYAEMIQMFGSIDEIPSSFIEDLGNSLAYEYVQDEDPEVQREVIKRILRIYKNRSTRTSIEKVLESSTDRNWVGDDLTLYHGPILKGYRNVWHPYEKIFVHDKSYHDRGDRFMDRLFYNYGIIALELQFYDERTEEMLEQQIPGGIRWAIIFLIWMKGEGTEFPSYYDEFNEVQYSEEITLKNDTVWVLSKLARFDTLGQTGQYVSDVDYIGAPTISGSLDEDVPDDVLSGGLLGVYPVDTISGGVLAGSSITIRSGRRVAIVDISEEFAIAASYIDNLAIDADTIGAFSSIIYDAGIIGSGVTPELYLEDGVDTQDQGQVNLNHDITWPIRGFTIEEITVLQDSIDAGQIGDSTCDMVVDAGNLADPLSEDKWIDSMSKYRED